MLYMILGKLQINRLDYLINRTETFILVFVCKEAAKADSTYVSSVINKSLTDMISQQETKVVSRTCILVYI